MVDWPQRLDAAWAWEGSLGEGVRVCVIDSGIGAHPRVGEVDEAFVVTVDEEDEVLVADDDAGDVCGHGTACAGIVRSVAPSCRLASIRVLGAGATGGGRELIAGIRLAIDRGYEVVNLSLSTTRRTFAAALHELADAAYFRRCLLVACAHNSPVDSYPWQFASVVSVAGHAGGDPMQFFVNPQAPPEFYARGLDVEVAWPGGGTIRASGNSFAAPHLAAICALIRAKHPDLTPAQVKTVLSQTASNAHP